MRRLTIVLMTAAMLSSACGAETATQLPFDGVADAPDDTVRVPASVLADVDAPIPDNVGAIDLGEVAPDDEIAFCEAFATAPARWVDDAVVPVQFWVDSFTAAQLSAPSEAAASIDRLISHGEDTLAWNFGRLDDRPQWDSALAEDARNIADVAVAQCPDLPLIAAPEGQSDTPSYWSEDTAEQISASCQWDADDVDEGIDWYLTEFGTLPGHQQQIETAANAIFYKAIEKTNQYPDDAFIYFASSYYGVGPDGEAMAVPGGACDS